MEEKMEFLCDMWRFSAEEYMTFLERNGVRCFGVYILYRNKVVIFADEHKYLDLSFNDTKFAQDEKQLIKLLERTEKLVEKLIEYAVKAQTNVDENEDISQEYDDQE